MSRKIPANIREIFLRSDSAFYNKEVAEFCEGKGWEFSITADQTGPLMRWVEDLADLAWKPDPADASLAYAEVRYQPVHWLKAFRFLVRREKREKRFQEVLFAPLAYSYYVVATQSGGRGQTLMETHDQRGAMERRIGQFTNEFLSHLPLGGFMANWVYLLCAQLAYNLS